MGDYSDPIAETFTITKRIYTDLTPKRDLVFVKLTVLEGGLPFWLEGHYDEANEDVDHEEGDDDDVDEVEESHVGTVVMNWPMVNFVGVYGDVEDARPSLEGHGDEEGEHGLGHIVKVELVLPPVSLVHRVQTRWTIFWHKIFSPAFLLSLARIILTSSFYL